MAVVALLVELEVAEPAVPPPVPPSTLLDSFLALEVVGFIKLKLALGVVRRALAGLEGVNVAEDVIRMGLERILGVEVVGLILVRS